MSPAVADEAALYFTVGLTVLLAASVLAVLRQPSWLPGPGAGAGEQPRHPGADGPAGPGDEGSWAAPGPWSGAGAWGDSPDAWNEDQAQWGAGRDHGPGGAPARPGRHAVRPPAAPAPLPVRSPGQSGWTAPAADGDPGRPDSWRPPVSGGPPWGPAPPPPRAR